MEKHEHKRFIEIKNRDAWSVIRGYVYQIDNTILRWISLTDDQSLELEKGEDYDLIKKTAEGEEISRELDQIKYRENNVTLTSDTVLESLINFCTHIEGNPEFDLQFRFVTNTGYGVERPALFTNGEAGIEVWIELNQLKDIKVDNKRLIVIRDHLVKKIDEKILKKGEENSTTEKAFKEYIKDIAKFINLIKKFEWSVENNDEAAITDTIKLELLKSGHAVEANVDEIYSRLFLSLFKLLSNRGEKNITRKLFLEQCELAALSRADNELNVSLKELVGSIQDRVTKLESEMKESADKINELVANFETGNIATTFSYKQSPITTQIAELVNFASLRSLKVDAIIGRFQQNVCLGIVGINGTGKTQLASLVARKFEKCWWLDLRAFFGNEMQASLMLRTFLAKISGTPEANEVSNWINVVGSKLPEGCLIVINDLPPILPDSTCSNIIAGLTNTFVGTNKRLLITSNQDYTRALRQSVDPNIVTIYSDLDFNDEEIIEFLVNSGVNEIYYQYIYLIASRTRRNARLVSAVLYHLLQQPAQTDREAVLAILDKDVTEEILSDTQRAVSTYIKNPESKELLYRLSLVHWDYKFALIQKICGVENVIQHPRDQLSQITNVWVQIQGDTFLTSPLAYDLGRENLTEATMKLVYNAVGTSIIDEKTLDHISASRAIQSFLQGHDFDGAGRVLVTVLNSADTPETINYTYQWGYLSYWLHEPIPKEMSIRLRTVIRIEQRRICHSLGLPVTFINNEIRSYFREEHTGVERVVIATSIIAGFDLNDRSFFEYFNYLIDNLGLLTMPREHEVDPEMFSKLLWSPVMFLFDKEDIVLWLGALDKVRNKFGINLLTDEAAANAISVIKNRIVQDHKRISNDEKYRAEAIEKLNILLEHFKQYQIEKLEAIIYSELLIIRYYVLDEGFKIEADAEEEIKQYKDDEAVYTLSAAVGKLLHPDSRSVRWIERATATKLYTAHTFSETLVYSAFSTVKYNPSLAVAYCITALEIILKNSEFETDHLQYVGEVALALWTNEQNEEAFKYFCQLIDGLFEVKEQGKEDPIWYRLIVLAGHALAYITADVLHEEAPKYADKSEFFKPEIGFFTVNAKDALRDLYQYKNTPILLIYMASLSYAIGNNNGADYWATRAFDFARKTGDPNIITMVLMFGSQYPLINARFNVAFEQALMNGVIAAYSTKPGVKRAEMFEGVSIEQIYGDKPSEHWDTGEETSVAFAVIPMVISVGNLILENHAQAQNKATELLGVIHYYIPSSSKPDYWRQIEEMMSNIFSADSSNDVLYEKESLYSKDESTKHLQLLAIVGLIIKEESNIKAIQQLINGIPYFSKILDKTPSIINTVLVPFAKSVCRNRLKNNFVGDKKELEILLSKIDLVVNRDPFALQNILKITLDEMGIPVTSDRQEWLNAQSR